MFALRPIDIYAGLIRQPVLRAHNQRVHNDRANVLRDLFDGLTFVGTAVALIALTLCLIDWLLG
jgi:hypothetical protein